MATESLKVESYTVGKKSKTQVALLYVEGTAPDELVNKVRKTLDKMDNDFVLCIKYVTEALQTGRSFFDTIGYAEKAGYGRIQAL